MNWQGLAVIIFVIAFAVSIHFLQASRWNWKLAGPLCIGTASYSFSMFTNDFSNPFNGLALGFLVAGILGVFVPLNEKTRKNYGWLMVLSSIMFVAQALWIGFYLGAGFSLLFAGVGWWFGVKGNPVIGGQS